MLGLEARACWEQSEPSFGRAPLACTVLHAMCDSILPCYPGNLRARRGDAMCECVRAPPRADTDLFSPSKKCDEMDSGDHNRVHTNQIQIKIQMHDNSPIGLRNETQEIHIVRVRDDRTWYRKAISTLRFSRLMSEMSHTETP